MKKIVYLVAPLMVMPFLVGCNKVKTHKVQSVLSVESKLKFYTMKGKDLKNTSFNHNQTFKFKVETVDEAGLTIEPNGIGIYVGEPSDTSLPLLSGYTVKYTNDQHTAAVVTVDAEQVTDDIYIKSIAAKANHYIYCIPIMLGVDLPNGEPTLGWQKKGENFTFEFKGKGDNVAPDQDCFLYTDDAETFHYYNEVEEDKWVTDHVSFTKATDKEGAKVAFKNLDYVLIAARSGKTSNFLDSFSWDEIKEISARQYATYIFSLGDEKTIKFSDGLSYKVRIIGFNHDKNKNGEVAGITFQFTTVICVKNGTIEKTVWDEDGSSTYFPNSDLNIAINGAMVYEKLPEDLQKNIMQVRKYVGVHRNNEWKAQHYDTDLFPLARAEMITTKSSYDVDGEGTIYPYYIVNHDAAGRTQTDLKGGLAKYWLRSPRIGDSYTDLAWTVNTYGQFTEDGEYVNEVDHGVTPAFCI